MLKHSILFKWKKETGGTKIKNEKRFWCWFSINWTIFNSTRSNASVDNTKMIKKLFCFHSNVLSHVFHIILSQLLYHWFLFCSFYSCAQFFTIFWFCLLGNVGEVLLCGLQFNILFFSTFVILVHCVQYIWLLRLRSE